MIKTLISVIESREHKETTNASILEIDEINFPACNMRILNSFAHSSVDWIQSAMRNVYKWVAVAFVARDEQIRNDVVLSENTLCDIWHGRKPFIGFATSRATVHDRCVILVRVYCRAQSRRTRGTFDLTLIRSMDPARLPDTEQARSALYVRQLYVHTYIGPVVRSIGHEEKRERERDR